MDRIKEMMDSLSELDDSQVAELQKSIVSEFESVEKSDTTPQTVDAMTSLADMLDTVRTELKSREAAIQELAQRAAEAATRVHGAEGEVAKEDGSEDSSETPMEDAPAEDKPMTETAEMPVEEKKDEEVPAEAPMVEENPTAPATAEAPISTEAPAAEAEETPADAKEDEDEEEKKKTMTEASTEAEKTVELSTEVTTETVAEAPVAEAPVTASAEDEAAPVAEEAPAVDAPAEAEAEAEVVADDAVAADDVAAEDDAAADVSDDAEASIKETPTIELSVQETMEAPVTAAANADNLNIEVPASHRPVTQASAAPVAITAGADIPGYTAGSALEDMSTVATAMEKRIHSLRRVNGGDGEQHIVASITTSFPEDRTLTTDAESNWAKINNVTSPEALVAAGGHVAPFEVRYDIFGFGTTSRPVRDALPRFQADRGGIRFITPPVLSDYADAVGVWTAANDAATTPSPGAKASLTVTAAGENTVATDAVTLQMQFGNLATRAYPELIARHNELGLIQHAREAEQNLLAKIASASTAVTTTSLIGFGRDFLVQVGRASAAYRSRHRLEADAPLRVIIPAWVKDAMAADLALSMPGDSTLNAYGEIDGYLAARGVVVSYSLDQNVFGAQGVTSLVEFTDSFTWYLFAEGTFLFLDGGTLDLGIIRDSSLVGTNDYKMFVETFEGIAKVGIEGLAITSTISVNGVAAALRDTTGGATAAAVEY